MNVIRLDVFQDMAKCAAGLHKIPGEDVSNLVLSAQYPGGKDNKGPLMLQLTKGVPLPKDSVESKKVQENCRKLRENLYKVISGEFEANHLDKIASVKAFLQNARRILGLNKDGAATTSKDLGIETFHDLMVNYQREVDQCNNKKPDPESKLWNEQVKIPDQSKAKSLGESKTDIPVKSKTKTKSLSESKTKSPVKSKTKSPVKSKTDIPGKSMPKPLRESTEHGGFMKTLEKNIRKSENWRRTIKGKKQLSRLKKTGANKETNANKTKTGNKEKKRGLNTGNIVKSNIDRNSCDTVKNLINIIEQNKDKLPRLGQPNGGKSQVPKTSSEFKISKSESNLPMQPEMQSKVQTNRKSCLDDVPEDKTITTAKKIEIIKNGTNKNVNVFTDMDTFIECISACNKKVNNVNVINIAGHNNINNEGLNIINNILEKTIHVALKDMGPEADFFDSIVKDFEQLRRLFNSEMEGGSIADVLGRSRAFFVGRPEYRKDFLREILYSMVRIAVRLAENDFLSNPDNAGKKPCQQDLIMALSTSNLEDAYCLVAGSFEEVVSYKEKGYEKESITQEDYRPITDNNYKDRLAALKADLAFTEDVVEKDLAGVEEQSLEELERLLGEE